MPAFRRPALPPVLLPATAFLTVLLTSLLTGLLPRSATAQQIHVGRIDSCPALTGPVSITYHNVQQRPHRTQLFRATICVSPEGGWFVGPDTIQGFTPVQRFDEGSVQYTVLDPALQPFERSTFYIGPVVGPPGTGEGVESLSFSLRPTPAGPMPDANFVDGRGWLFDAAMPRLSSLPTGLWLLDLYLAEGLIPETPANAVEMGPMVFAGFTLLAERQPDGNFRLLRISDSAIQVNALSLSTGPLGVSGQFAFTTTNRVAPVARAVNEWDSASAVITGLTAEALATGPGMVLAVGTGDITGRHLDGRVFTRPVWMHLSASALPPGTDPQSLADYFPP